MARPTRPRKKSAPRDTSGARHGPGGEQLPNRYTYREFLGQVFDDFEIGVAHVLASGKIVYSNQRFALALGLAAHRDLTGWNLHDLVEPHSWQFLGAALSKGLQGPVTGEMRLVSVAGRVQTIRVSLSPAHPPQYKVIRIVTDEVTELVETNLRLRETESSLHSLSAEILRVQDQERRKMARDLHDTSGQELAILVMSLRHLADNLERPGINVRDALEDAAELARKVNEDIRTFSYVLHPPLLDQLGLASALRWYVEGFRSRSTVDVNLVIPDDLPRFSLEKETALFRVVQEGLTNVLRHSGSNTAKIVIRVSVDDVELTVTDTGKGLSQAQVRHLDEAQPTTGGVGLAGLRERLHHLGGKLRISGDREGTVLRAILPLEPSELDAHEELQEVAPGAEKRAPEDSPQTNGRKRILLVDDHDVVRRGIRGLLSSYDDLEVCGEASTGDEALHRTNELHPDLIILDLNMPGVGGISAANQIQKLRPPPKILIFTMHSFPGVERIARAAGCKGLVSKVYAERDLLPAIRTVLAGGEFFNGQQQIPLVVLAQRA